MFLKKTVFTIVTLVSNNRQKADAATHGYVFLVADTQLYKRLCPSVRWLVGRSVTTSRKVGKRAFPPLPTRPQLMAVYPALFYAHLDYHDTFYRLLHFEIIIISTALSPSLYHLSCLYYIHPSYNSPFIILFPFRYTGAQYFLRSSLPSYAHPTLLCFSTLQRLPSSHPFLITHLIRFIHCDTTTSPPFPIPPPHPIYTH